MKFFAALLFASSTVLCAAEFVTGQAARLVIGQPTFTRQLPGPTESNLGAASGLALNNDNLFVVDSSRVAAGPQNSRVLIFRGISSQLPAPKVSIPWEGTIPERCPVCGGVAANVLGQKDFTSADVGIGANQFRDPTAVATDGKVLAVADTDNNRVLIWLSLPVSDTQPADLVVGQPDFNNVNINYGGNASTPSAKGLRGPQGLWIQDGRLFIADTQNNRVLIYNNIPRASGASADLVVGAPDFTTFVQSDLVQASLKATATDMLNPVSVTSDGLRLYVADLGHNRVMIWNRIPAQNGTPVDVVVGQSDANSSDTNKAYLANNSTQLCAPTFTDDTGKPGFPALCAATLNYPRFALSDGKRLFIADGGNDRVLVYNEIPNSNGQAADAVLGQISDTVVQDSDPVRISAADTIRTPSSLAWDGSNLFVSDPFNRRILVFTPGDQPLPANGVRNAASGAIFALGGVAFTQDPAENDEATLKIGEKEYKYKAVKDDKIENVVRALVTSINDGAGDPLVLATANVAFNQILLTARVSGESGNAITYSITLSAGAQLAATTAGATLSGGQNAAYIAPGSLVMILGEDLADDTASAPADAVDLPQTLAGVEVYFDGIRAPLMYVSPTQINSQMPWEVNDSSSVSAYVRKVAKDGSVKVTSAIAVPIIPQNPGIFAGPGETDPRPAQMMHASSSATGVISVDGSIKEGDVATVKIEDRSYSYTITAADTLPSVRDQLIGKINAAEDEKVSASPAGVYTRLLLTAKVPGPEGEGIAYTGSANDGASIIVTALSPTLCCSSKEGAMVTEDDPAKPGEIVIVYATGLGIVQPDEAKFAQVTGSIYRGPEQNQPNTPVDDAQAGGKTANVLEARLMPGTVGVYEVKLQLNSDIPTNPQTQLWIAQNGFISNIVAFPLVNPNPPATE
jgi:hypothetical protein